MTNDALPTHQPETDTRQSQAVMESLLAATTEIIWVFDDSGPIVASLPARQLIGLASDDPIEHLRLHEILPNWAAVRFIDEGMSLVESGEPWSASLAMRDHSGERAAMVTLAHRHEYNPRKRRLWTLHGRWLEAAPAGEALRDELTGLLSEAMFTEYLNQSIARSARSGTPVSIVILELDHFDSITNHLGGQMTDRLLQATAECLSSNLRAGDTLARLAGGRFAVGRETMPDIRDAARFGERLRTTLDQPLVVDGAEWYLCASGGVALTRPGMTTAQGLLRNADAALHQARLSGRGHSVVFGASLGSNSAPSSHRSARWHPRPPQPPHRNKGSSTESWPTTNRPRGLGTVVWMDAALDLDGRKASDISDSIEASIREGQLAAGAQLPTVRSLADQLQVSPSTVSAAYRHLRQRGVISTHGRGGTRVHSRPPVEVAKPFRLDAGLRDLRGLVPASELGQILREVVQELAEHRQMDEEDEFELENRLAKDLSADGINIDHVLAVGSAREGLSRVLESHLLPGDRVAIEAPSSGPVTEVLSLNGLDAVPVEMDRQGATAVSLAATLNGVDAVILTPRAQDPTGAVMTSQRASEIRVELRRRPDVLLVEWDPQGPLAGTDYEPVADPDRSHWATIRSYDDTFAGQLTLAAVAGDPVTLARVRGRQLLSGSGLPPLVRRLAANVLAHPGTPRRAEGQARQNGSRRVVLLAALRNRGIVGDGQSGPYIWVPTRDQAGTVDAMKAKGWLVGDAKRPTTTSPQGIRVSVADLDATSAARFADDLLEVLAEL